jgi:hypothetical protein
MASLLKTPQSTGVTPVPTASGMLPSTTLPLANRPAIAPTGTSSVTAPTAQPLPSTTPPAASGLLTPVDPASNLRGQQINPITSPQLGQTNTLLQGVAQNLGGMVTQPPQFQDEILQNIRGATPEFRPISRTDFESRDVGFDPIAAGTFQGSPEEQRARALSAMNLEGLQNLPDRAQLALEAFNLFREQGEPGFQRSLQDVGRNAAAFGRTNAGMTTNELTDVVSQRERDLDLMRRGLINQASGLTIQDQMDRLNAGLGAGGEFQRRNLADQGFQQGLRQESRLDRNTGLDVASSNANRALQALGLQSQENLGIGGLETQRGIAGSNAALGQAGALAGLGQQGFGQNLAALNALGGLSNLQFGQGLTERNELRGERGFQDQLSQTGINNALQEALLSEQLGQGGFNRDLAIQNALAGVGMSPTTQGLELFGAGGVNTGGGGSTADILAQSALAQGSPGGTSPTAGLPPPVPFPGPEPTIGLAGTGLAAPQPLPIRNTTI